MARPWYATGPLWSPLTTSLKETGSPVRRLLDQRFPHVRELQARYRTQAGPLIVDASAAPSGTLGTAFDWLARFLLHPHPDLSPAGVGLFRWPALVDALNELAERLSCPLDSPAGFRFDGPAKGSTVDPELLARGCWAVALLTEVYRAGDIMPGSPLAAVDPYRVGADELLCLVPAAALAELAQLRAVAERNLVPALADRTGGWVLGPRFTGSRLMNADADVIASGLLIELKTSLGAKRSNGTRQASLDGQTILQLVGYVLLDFTDEYALDQVGLYTARYGRLAVWDLRSFLDELAGHPVDLAAERAEFKALLLSR